jgi:transposase-like protein
VNGEQKYLLSSGLYGQTIDVLLAAKRDAAAAKRFYRKAFLISQ